VNDGLAGFWFPFTFIGIFANVAKLFYLIGLLS